jgi:type VI protein secretion system component VasF
MAMDTDDFDLEPAEEAEEEEEEGGRGGFFTLALIVLALGAGSALLLAPAEGAKTRKRLGKEILELRGSAAKTVARIQREVRRRRTRDRREKRLYAVAGLVVGAGLGAFLRPLASREETETGVEEMAAVQRPAAQESERPFEPAH